MTNFTYKGIYVEINGAMSHEHLKTVIFTPDIERYCVDAEEAKFIIDEFLETYVANDFPF